MLDSFLRFSLLSIPVIFLASCAGEGQTSPGDTPAARVQSGIDTALMQLSRTLDALDDVTAYPRSTDEDGRWRTVGAEDWTSGFFPGLLWLAYEATGEDQWRDHAREWTEGLREEQHTTSHHDLGFMLFNSFGQGYRLTGDEDYHAVAIQAARSLASRFNESVRATKSWDWSDDWQFPVIVDNMMNLELLFWAARETGDPRLHEIAVEHGHLTADEHVREDGGTYHVVDFDPETGAVLEKITHQGYADTSTWARGQAWGMYGFTMAYRESQEPRFLETARRLADFFLARAPEDLVPYWDFDAPGIPNEPRDVSAAAIVFSGLIELQEYVDDETRKRYREAAERLLVSLTSEPYLNRATESFGILRHGVGHLPAGSEIDVALIYADYYFLEGLLRYRERFL